MPTTSGTLEYAKTAVDDATQLAGVDVTAMDDGSLAFLRVTGKFYHLVRTSTASPDGTSVIVTKSGVGRWLVGPPSNPGDPISVPTEAALALLPTASSLVEGAIAYVQSQCSYWQIRTQALPIVAHVNIASADPTKQWVRQTMLTGIWLQIWSAAGVSLATTGNDDTGDGTPAKPLQTWAEIRRRLGVGPDGKTQIPNGQTLVVSAAAGNYPETLDLRGLAGAIDIVGAETTLASGTLNAYTNVNRASATGWAKLATAGFDFTPWLKNMFVITSGVTAGARGWIESIPGANQALITPASTQATRRSSPAIVVPVGTETFDVRQVATFFDSLAMDVSEDGLSVFTPQNTLWATYNFLAFASSLMATGRTIFNDCRLDKKSDFVTDLTLQGTGCCAITFNVCAVGSMTTATGTVGMLNLQTTCVFGGGGLGTLTSQNMDVTYVLGVDTLFSDGAVSMGNGGHISVGNCAFHNTIAGRHAFNFLGASGIVRVDFASGGNLYGSLLGANADVFRLGVGTTVFANGVIPVLVPGAGGVAVRFGTVTKTFANLNPQGYFDFVAGAQTGAMEQGSMWLP